MQIYWLGYSSIRIEATHNQQEVTLVTDPFENEGNLRFPRTLAPDVLVLSHQDRDRFNIEGVQGAPFIVSEPGEYEIKGLFVQGIQDPAVDDQERSRPVLFRMVVENMSLGFLGRIHRTLTDREIEALGDIDVLLLPVGGGDVLNSKSASEAIALIEPRVVVPLYHDIPGIKVPLEHVDQFCKSLGVCRRQDSNKLKLTKKDLPADDLLVAVLEKV
ncbi:MBL fold metallo-hydrolase [Candidatus Uhrbacteria bacterium]|nr:MBL fold metallo-hydrolase [Candidatus Uhrbacteria bacterium]